MVVDLAAREHDAHGIAGRIAIAATDIDGGGVARRPDRDRGRSRCDSGNGLEDLVDLRWRSHGMLQRGRQDHLAGIRRGLRVGQLLDDDEFVARHWADPEHATCDKAIAIVELKHVRTGGGNSADRQRFGAGRVVGQRDRLNQRPCGIIGIDAAGEGESAEGAYAPISPRVPSVTRTISPGVVNCELMTRRSTELLAATAAEGLV